ncbi:UNVERIFIED_CONTAM: hypothetical protein FKN15_054749, partial [Acipenser sinensis]
RLSAFSTDAAGQMDVFGHDGNPLGVNSTQIGIFKETDQLHNSGALEEQISLEILGDFPDKTLERQLEYQQLSRFLIAADLPQSHSTGPVPMRLLHAASRRSTFAGSLGYELLPGSLSSSGLMSRLLGSGHFLHQLE